MVREILNWCDKKAEKVTAEYDGSFKSNAKCFGIGAVEGAIDGLVINGALLIIVGGIATIFGKTNK